MANLKLFCNNPNIKTLKQFSDFYKLRVVEKKENNSNCITVDEFFEFNKDIIFSQLSTEQLQELSKEKSKKISDLSSSDLNKDMIIPCPSYLIIDEKLVNYSVVAKNTNFQIQEIDSIAFEDKSIRSIIDDSSQNFTPDIKRSKPGCRVIGYFKSMYFAGKRNEGKNKNIDNIYDSSQNFIDISPFVISLNTSVSNSGGNFSMTLPHVPVYSDELSNGLFIVDVFLNGLNSRNYINKEQFDKFNVNGQMSIKSEINEMDYFEWLIQPNDLLFISFDDMEDLTDDNLSGNTFDMIALVDNVSVSRSATGGVSIDINGRDLMKLITDDSSIFFPKGVSSGNKSIFDNTETVLRGGDLDSVIRYNGAENQDGTPRQITGLLDIFASEPNDFSIDFVLKVVISHLANMQIVPDDLFIKWGDKRTKFSALKPKK